MDKNGSLIHATVMQQIASAHSVLVAYSGGIDSTVLLHTLVELRNVAMPQLQIQAIYIHHGISQNADQWAEHCQNQCQQWQVTLKIEKVKLQLDKGNIEQQARDARYQAIRQYLSSDMVLCTAQHLDDQCETFLLALKRGSGPTGLSAMPAESRLGHHLFLRPLLTISREQIEAYARAYQLDWIEDESNQDAHYDRNFLRLHILPLLNQRWNHFNQMVARSAELCQQQQQLLDELLVDAFYQLIDSNQSLSIVPLLNAEFIKRNALLRMWFKSLQVNMPSRKQLELLWQNVALAKEDSNPQFILHHKQIRRYQNRLYLLPQYQNLQGITLSWDLSRSLLLPDDVGILSVNKSDLYGCRLPTADEKVTVRFDAQGKFNIVGRQGSRSIKKLWQELNIAPWMRHRIPLVYYNNQLVAAIGVFVTEFGRGEQLQFTLQVVSHKLNT